MDIVFIRGLRIETTIGIYDWEKEIRQPVVLDLEMASDIALGAASEPPVKGIALGNGSLKLGEETCLYRHEKTFVNQTALAVNVCDTDSPAEVDSKLAAVRDYVLERVGEVLTIDMVAVTQAGTDVDAFVALAELGLKLSDPSLIPLLTGRFHRPLLPSNP